jgi:hypothetical protein
MGLHVNLLSSFLVVSALVVALSLGQKKEKGEKRFCPLEHKGNRCISRRSVNS